MKSSRRSERAGPTPTCGVDGWEEERFPPTRGSKGNGVSDKRPMGMNARQWELTLWVLGFAGLLAVPPPRSGLDSYAHGVGRGAPAGIGWQWPGKAPENIDREEPPSEPREREPRREPLGAVRLVT
jgi:hypothetical protein